MRFVTESGMLSRVKVIALALRATVAVAGAATPVRAGGVVMMLPPAVTTQKFRRLKRLEPEILDLVPRTERPCAFPCGIVLALGAAHSLDARRGALATW